MSIIKRVMTHENPDQTSVMTVEQPLLSRKGPSGSGLMTMAVTSLLSWWDYFTWRWPCWNWKFLETGLKIVDGPMWYHQQTYSPKTVRMASWMDLSNKTTLDTSSHFCCPIYSDSIAYSEYKNDTPDDEFLTFDEWISKMEACHPQFRYLFKTLQLELLYLRFLHSQRQQDYKEYVPSLIAIIPWMIAFDHYHYSRWTSVHVSDLLTSEAKNNAAHNELLKGNFVSQKTKEIFRNGTWPSTWTTKCDCEDGGRL